MTLEEKFVHKEEKGRILGESYDDLLERDSLLLNIECVIDRFETLSANEGIRLAFERSVLQGLRNEFVVDGDTNLRVLSTDSSGKDCTV